VSLSSPPRGPGWNPTRHDVVAWGIALVAVGATFVPYLAQDASPPPGHVFSWTLTAVPDQCSYLMWMDQHRAGALRPADRMTTDAIGGGFLPNPAWVALGWLAAATGLSLAAAFHAGRALLGLGYLLVLWALMRAWLPGRPRAALAGFGLAAIGSGLAWVQAVGLPVMTADWMPELWTWQSLLYFPHFAASLLLACGALLLLARGRGWAAGGLLALLVFVHPYTALPLGLAIGLRWLACRWRGVLDAAAGRRDLAALLPWAVAMASLAGWFAANPGMRGWAERNVMPSPPPWQYALGLGLVFVLAAWGAVRLAVRREWDASRALWVSWIAVAALLAYASPLVPYERRCVEGVHVAFAALAASAIAGWLERLRPARAAAAIAGLLVAVVPTNALLLRQEATARNPGQVRDDWPSLWDAVRGLPGDAADRTVFTDARTGLFLAAFGGATVFAGHNELTPDFPQKMRVIREFFERPASWPARVATIRAAGCRWLVMDPEDAAALGPDGPPADLLVARGRTWGIWGPL